MGREWHRRGGKEKEERGGEGGERVERKGEGKGEGMCRGPESGLPRGQRWQSAGLFLPVSHTVGDVTLPYVDCVTDLVGVTYDKRLRFSSHINKIVTKVRSVQS